MKSIIVTLIPSQQNIKYFISTAASKTVHVNDFYGEIQNSCLFRTEFERKKKTIFHQQLQCVLLCGCAAVCVYTVHTRALSCVLSALKHSNDTKLIFSRFNLLGLKTMMQIYYRIFMIFFPLLSFRMQMCNQKG